MTTCAFECRFERSVFSIRLDSSLPKCLSRTRLCSLGHDLTLRKCAALQLQYDGGALERPGI